MEMFWARVGEAVKIRKKRGERRAGVAQTTEFQTERERSPFAARSSVRIGQNTARLSAFGAAATGDRSRSGG